MVTFLLAGGVRGRFWLAFALSAVAQYILGAIPPGPGYFSALLFGIGLLLLREARRSGSDFPLLFLPFCSCSGQMCTCNSFTVLACWLFL